VYPPVDTDFFRPAPAAAERFALVVSALVPYKRIDLAVAACRLAGVPLVVAGDGPERPALQRLAGTDVTFLGRVSDEEVRTLYQRAAVTLLPGEEDFGIVPVEAQACGRPVVALARGGARETVVDGVTGTLVQEPTPQAFAAAIARTVEQPFAPAVIRSHAEQFGAGRFAGEMDMTIRSLMTPASAEANAAPA
jgi:glycosyltransferase involved in cell wall biosynthesis